MSTIDITKDLENATLVVSSVFTATPVAIVLEKYAKSPPPQPKDKPKAPVRRTSDSSGAVV